MKDVIKRLLGRNSRLLLEFYYEARYLLFHRGWACCCPCCGRHLRQFLNAKMGSRGQVGAIRCPRCDSHPRHRLLWLFLQSELRQLFSESLNMLHIAPEFCFLRRFRKMVNLRYVTGDFASPLADCRLDLMSLPFANEAFDVVFCNHVLEHVRDDARAIREIYRVLKPGGWGILQVPVDVQRKVTFEDLSITTPAERAMHFGQHDHVRQYGADYPGRLRTAGFTVRVVDYAQAIEANLLKYYGLDPTEAIYLCIRPFDAVAGESVL